MRVASFDSIVRCLNEAKVRFIVVGGLAVSAQGYLRFTRDVDLVIRLQPSDIVAAFRALSSIGYLPAVPITAEDFADPRQRSIWRTEKGMLVLKFWSDLHRETPLDVFVYEPFAFEEEERIALVPPRPPGLEVKFASVASLIAMKRVANREQDRIDIEKLTQIAELQHRDPKPGND